MSTGLDLSKLMEKQEELNKRGSGASNWIQVSKIEKPLDFRILDPLPSMDGIYYVEVPIWWINGHRLISKKLYGPDEVDVVEEIKKEAEKVAKTDKTISELLKKKGEKGISLIQFKWEYWIPVLEFEWDMDRSNKIAGIYAPDGSVDPALVAKFIKDQRVKILVANITTLKAINALATTRGYGNMMTREEGVNLILTKTGKDRDTKYTVTPDSGRMPMPAEYYQEGKLTDPFEIAESLMYTDEYMKAVIENYIYGDVEIPEDSDDNYANPEIRAKLKERFKEGTESTEQAPPPRRRPGAPAPAPEAPAPAPTPAPAPAESATTSTRGRRAAPAADAAPAASRPRSRNLLNDIKNV